MKHLTIALLALTLAGGTSFGQTSTNAPVAPPAPPATVQGGVQQILDALSTTNIYAVTYASYGSGIRNHWGGGVGLFFPILTNGVTFDVGTRIQWFDGGLVMPSGNAALGVPITVAGMTFTPLAYAGIGLPLSGTDVQGFQVPGNALPAAFPIMGYGIHANLYTSTKVNVGFIAERETWPGTGVSTMYNFGPVFHIKF